MGSIVIWSIGKYL